MPWIEEREANSCNGCAFYEVMDRGEECAPGVLHDCDNKGLRYVPKDDDNINQMYLVAQVQRKLGVGKNELA